MVLIVKPSVLFVSDTTADNPYLDPSVRYRCFNMSQELVRRGFRSHVVPQSLFDAGLRGMTGFDRYVFHRPRLTPALAEFLVGLPAGRAVADFDDLIFDVRHAEATPTVRIRKRPPAEVRHYVASMAESLRLISRATVSTVPLARHAQQFNHLAVSVVHNHVDPAFLGVAQVLRAANPYGRRPFMFGYFSGTATHDLDFEIVGPALAQALRLNRDARLLIVGPLALPETFGAYAKQIRRMGILPFHALPSVMAQCQKVVAPLEDTVFTESKSGLKYFEAALVGCDVLATPIPDIDRFQSPLLSKCRTPEDWTDAVVKERVLHPAEVEQCARELEVSVRIEAAVPGWLKAVELEAE